MQQEHWLGQGLRGVRRGAAAQHSQSAVATQAAADAQLFGQQQWRQHPF